MKRIISLLLCVIMTVGICCSCSKDSNETGKVKLKIGYWPNKDTDPEKVQHANDFLTLAGMIERTCYPVSCKYYHQLVGVPMSTYCRSADPHRLDNAAKEEVEALIRMENHIREELGIG